MKRDDYRALETRLDGGGGGQGREKATGVSPPAQSIILVAMDRWMGEQHSFTVKAYYQNGESFVQTRRAFRRHFDIPHNQSLLNSCDVFRCSNSFYTPAFSFRRRCCLLEVVYPYSNRII